MQILDTLIEQKPGYSGWRYYLRALIDYEIGDIDKTEQDLATGAGNTWGHLGLYAYVQGKLALDRGDNKEGILLLQEAEASLDVNFNPLPTAYLSLNSKY